MDYYDIVWCFISFNSLRACTPRPVLKKATMRGVYEGVATRVREKMRAVLLTYLTCIELVYTYQQLSQKWAASKGCYCCAIRDGIQLLHRRTSVSRYCAASSCRYSLLWPSNCGLPQPIRACRVWTTVHSRTFLLPRPLSRCVLGCYQLCTRIDRHFHSRYIWLKMPD